MTDAIRGRIVDLRGKTEQVVSADHGSRLIYVTDSVFLDISATDIRNRIRTGDPSWVDDVLPEVAKHIEKYQIYS